MKYIPGEYYIMQLSIPFRILQTCREFSLRVVGLNLSIPFRILLQFYILVFYLIRFLMFVFGVCAVLFLVVFTGDMIYAFF